MRPPTQIHVILLSFLPSPSSSQQGLAAAIRLKQLANAKGTELSVCVVEKGAEVGAHILSGTSIVSGSCMQQSLEERAREYLATCPLCVHIIGPAAL